MTIWYVFFTVTILLFVFCVLCFLDHRKRRAPVGAMPVSFLIPCYNDGATIGETVASIYASWPSEHCEVLVVDDASTDDTPERLVALQRDYPIRVERNPQNLGKADSLNVLTGHAAHEILVFLDADTCLRPVALQDLLSRLLHDKHVGAVSCPYRPANRGFLPRLQAIDYSMITVLQGAYNLFSCLALWGGCICIRREALQEAGGFDRSAITEDVELAYVLNLHHWRVEQSLMAVDSYVPETWRGWFRQKTRWTSGGFQCLLRHPRVWLKNPLQVLLTVLYSVLAVHAAYGFIRQVLFLDQVFEQLFGLLEALPVGAAFQSMDRVYRYYFVHSMQLTVCFILLTSVYVIPLISRWRDGWLLLLVVPFSLLYFPMYSLLAIAGMYHVVVNSRRFAREERAW